MLGNPKLNKFRNTIVSAAPAEKPMEESDHKEKYEVLDDTFVLYTRQIPVISGTGFVLYDVQVHLTHNYLRSTPPEVVKQYLNRAVAAILTRNGCKDA